MSKAHVTSLHHVANVWQHMSGGIIWTMHVQLGMSIAFSEHATGVFYTFSPILIMSRIVQIVLQYCRALKRQKAFVVGSIARPSRLFWVVIALENAT